MSRCWSVSKRPVTVAERARVISALRDLSCVGFLKSIRKTVHKDRVGGYIMYFHRKVTRFGTVLHCTSVVNQTNCPANISCFAEFHIAMSSCPLKERGRELNTVTTLSLLRTFGTFRLPFHKNVV
jgi:hypothetical protein